MSDTPAAPPPNPMAIASLVCGVLALVTSCCCTYGAPFNMLGLVLGIVAVVQSNSDPNLGGKNLAFAGIGASVFSFLVAVGMVIFGVGMGMLSAVMDNM